MRPSINDRRQDFGHILVRGASTALIVQVLGVALSYNVGLNLLLIPPLGIFGAAIATAIAMITWNLWLHSLVVRHVGVRPSIVAALRSR